MSKGGSRFLPAHPVCDIDAICENTTCFQHPRGEGAEGRGRGAAAGRRTAAEKAAAGIGDACHPWEQGVSPGPQTLLVSGSLLL